MMTITPEFLGTLFTVVGALAGAITFLFRSLIESKDATIKLLTEDRNYWRGVSQGMSQHPQYPYPPTGYPPTGTGD